MSKGFLLDTNVCIFFLQGKFGIKDRVLEVGRKNCFVSEITIAELLFGAAYSNNDKHKNDVKLIQDVFKTLPIFDALPTYASVKADLRHKGLLIDEFDLLIGASAVHHDLVMATENIAHFNRIPNIVIDNWVKRT